MDYLIYDDSREGKQRNSLSSARLRATSAFDCGRAVALDVWESSRLWFFPPFPPHFDADPDNQRPWHDDAQTQDDEHHHYRQRLKGVEEAGADGWPQAFVAGDDGAVVDQSHAELDRCQFAFGGFRVGRRFLGLDAAGGFDLL